MDKAELERELLAQAPIQWQRFQQRKEKMKKSKAKWQRDLEDIDNKAEEAKRRADELRHKYDPNLMKMERQFTERFEKTASKLVCPNCGEGDHGNIMNGKPWCFKCNCPLMPKERDKLRKQPRIKVMPPLKDELRHLGLNPKNEV